MRLAVAAALTLLTLLPVGEDVCPDCGFNPQHCDCDEIDLDLLDCTHCGGEGLCDANANPLWDCDDQYHDCHACGGSGKRRDQRIF